MRILALALCGVLLTAGLAQAAPADRAALLERLRVALPRIAEFMPVEKLLTADLRKAILTQNPGKEAAVNPIVDGFGACVVRIIDNLDYATAAVAGADKAGMTEAELLKVVTFFEHPDTKLMFAAIGEALISETEPDIDPEALERLEALGNDPAIDRFGEIMGESAEGLFDEEAMTDEVVVCMADMHGAIDDAGLTYNEAVADEDEQ
jgi:hypothetical protein